MIAEPCLKGLQSTIEEHCKNGGNVWDFLSHVWKKHYQNDNEKFYSLIFSRENRRKIYLRFFKKFICPTFLFSECFIFLKEWRI
jgi:hypothetical protein